MLSVESVKSGVRRGSEEGIEVSVVREKKKVTIFFPNIPTVGFHDVREVCSSDDVVANDSFLVSAIQDGSVYHLPRAIHAAASIGSRGIDESKPFPLILIFKDAQTGDVYAQGKGNDGKTYFARIYSEPLYSELKHRHEKYEERLMQEAFKKEEPHLKKLVEAGRYEDAAALYERFGMLEEARGMRQRAKEHTVVRLDLNRLFNQLAERGFTITYHCSNCGAPLEVSGEAKAEAFRFCSHCGSRIEAIDLAEFLKSHLS